jgi:hypothetical protein
LTCLSDFEAIRHFFHDNSNTTWDGDQTETENVFETDLNEYEDGDYAEWYGLMLELAVCFTGWPQEAVSKTVSRFERRVAQWSKRKQAGVLVA